MSESAPDGRIVKLLPAAFVFPVPLAEPDSKLKLNWFRLTPHIVAVTVPTAVTESPNVSEIAVFV